MMAGMITLILIGLLRGIRTHRALVLENLALRHQLAVLQRSAPRLRLRRSDRLLWVLLARLWRGWPDGVSTTTVPGPTSPWRRTLRSQDGWSTLTTAGSSRPPWSEASIIGTRARRRKTVRPAGGVPATRRAPVGRSARFASVFFRLASETPHGTRGSTRGVLSEPRSVLLTNGRSRSSEHLDGLNGRDRASAPRVHGSARRLQP